MIKYIKLKRRDFDKNLFSKDGLVIQEKLDGANVSFTLENGELKAYSRNLEIDKTSRISCFYNFIEREMGVKITDFWVKYILENYIVFGEWLKPHTVKYASQYENKFYVFDVYEKKTGEFKGLETVKEFSKKLGLNNVRTFKIIEAEELSTMTNAYLNEVINRFVGVSNKTEVEDTGEGVVVKSLGDRKYDDYVHKRVSVNFSEIKGDEVKPNKKDYCSSALDYAVSEVRMEKWINKVIDEGLLSEDDIKIENFSKIMGVVAKKYVDDILDEELSILVSSIEKNIKKQTPYILKSVLKKKEG